MTTHSPTPSSLRQSQIRKDFDLEPNPFEQSFSVRPNSNLRTNTHFNDSDENSPVSDSPPPPSTTTTTTTRPVLPPLASIASPADPASYSWSFPATTTLANSLRDGPLSPAMLAGPQSQPASDQQFDSYRTGLTPRSGLTPRTGLTPATGLTPLVAPSAPFPPSPNTAAFLALMNNNAPTNNAPTTQTITPNTLNAITGALNPSSTSHYPHHPSQLQNSHTQDANPAYNPANPTSSAANGLFLLSQAHQELTKREEAQRANANGTANGTKRGSKRKPYDLRTASPPPQQRASAKRTRANTRRRSSPRVSDDPGADDDDDEEDDEDPADDSADPGSRRGGNKKPETEEEKRRNFLERNRQAALKCRQRKKAWLAQLQAKVEFLSNENERLTSALVSSREEISRLSALVGGAAVGPGVQHMSSAVGLVNPAGATAAQPVSINVSLSGKPVPPSSSRAGYGY